MWPSPRPCGQLVLLICICMHSSMCFTGLSDFPAIMGSDEYRTEVLGLACIKCQPHSLLAGQDWHIDT